MRYLLIALGALIVLCFASLFLLATGPHLQVQAPPAAIGGESPVSVHIDSPHGVRLATATLEQDGKSATKTIAQDKKHRLGYFKHEPPREVTFQIGKQELPALHDGKARITVTVKANDLIGETDTASFDVNVVTTPPHAVADGAQHYINQAGAELVTFHADRIIYRLRRAGRNPPFPKFPAADRSAARTLQLIRHAVGSAGGCEAVRVRDQPHRHRWPGYLLVQGFSQAVPHARYSDRPTTSSIRR